MTKDDHSSNSAFALEGNSYRSKISENCENYCVSSVDFGVFQCAQHFKVTIKIVRNYKSFDNMTTNLIVKELLKK